MASVVRRNGLRGLFLTADDMFLQTLASVLEEVITFDFGQQDIPEQTLDRRDQFTFAAEGSLGFDFLQTQVSVRPAGNRHSVPGLDLVGVEILAFDVVRLEECEAVFRRLDLGSERYLAALPFPIGENAVIDRSPVPACNPLLAPVQMLNRYDLPAVALG